MIEIDSSDLERAANLLKEFPGAVDRIAKRAVRASVKGVKREAIEKATQIYTISKGRLSGTMKVSYTGSGHGAFFSSKGRLQDLIYYKHNPSGRRVPTKRPPKGRYLYSEVIRGQGGTIAHAFLARMKSGHVGIFHRTGSPSKNNPEIEEIKQYKSPSVPHMLKNRYVKNYVEEHIRNRLSGAVDREVDSFLARYRQ